MIPDLPEGNWDGDVHVAFNRIDEWAGHAQILLGREDIEAIRLQVAAGHLHSAQGYRDAMLTAGLPELWVEDVLAECRILERRLHRAAAQSQPKLVKPGVHLVCEN